MAQETSKVSDKSKPTSVVKENLLDSNKKYLYFFSEKETDGSAAMKDVLGGKGANLAEMTSMGIPVPPGFTLCTELCEIYNSNGQKLPELIQTQIKDSIIKVGKLLGKEFGSVSNPLLVSVRSGARASMPGMMDTILNLGLNDKTVIGLAEQSNNPRFAKDSYRRFIQMYSNVVLGMNPSLLEVCFEDFKAERNYHLDTDMKESDLDELLKIYKMQVAEYTGQTFPEDPWE